jgi:hypothetical protein
MVELSTSVGRVEAIQVDRSHPGRAVGELDTDVRWLIPVRATDRRAGRDELVGAIPIHLPYPRPGRGEELAGAIPIHLPHPRPERDGDHVVGAIPINLPYPRPEGGEDYLAVIPIPIP